MIPQALLAEVVEELGEFVGELVFTGGATVWLYFERSRMGEIRPTEDADAVVDCASYVAYHRLLARLRDRGISARAGQIGPICRVQTPRGHILDVMPTRHEILGFGNPWFEEGVRRAVTVELGNGTPIKVFPASVFFAAKVAAYLDRGKDDPWISDDLHDLLVLLDCRPSLPEAIGRESTALRAALAGFARHLLDQPVLDELIASHLGASAPGWRVRAEAVQAGIAGIASDERS